MNEKTKLLRPLILLFVAVNSLLLLTKNLLAKYGLDYEVLLWANIILFFVNIIVFLMQRKAIANSNPNVFVRSVMGGTIIKMFVCLAASAVYAFAFKERFSKFSLFAAMVLYLVYLAVEAVAVSKMNKQKNA
jgi:putative effector of murein hydrolase LrgA (UPF0299 family)